MTILLYINRKALLLDTYLNHQATHTFRNDHSDNEVMKSEWKSEKKKSFVIYLIEKLAANIFSRKDTAFYRCDGTSESNINNRKS